MKDGTCLLYSGPCGKELLCTSNNKTPDPMVVKGASWRASWVEEENLGLWVGIMT